MSNRVNLSYVQFNPEFGNIDKNLKTVSKLLYKAKPGIVVLPELMNTGYNFISKNEVRGLSELSKTGKTSMLMSQISSDIKSTIVAGFVEKSKNHYYNSAMVVSKGKFIGVYRKTHLFYNEKQLFSKGNTGFRIFNIDNFKLGVMICSDWIWPESARTLALKGADIIAHPANLILKGLCQQTMPIRCFENSVFAITANRTGIEKRGKDSFHYTGQSQIVGPNMKILSRARSNCNSVNSVNVNLLNARNKTLFKNNDLIKDRRTKFYK
ncbi:MAG: hypothetical protein HS050_00330 [Thaumarchaeota archaeon]|nr:hypothetical protein [Nitrososphaerota archaeon]